MSVTFIFIQTADLIPPYLQIFLLFPRLFTTLYRILSLFTYIVQLLVPTKYLDNSVCTDTPFSKDIC